jgi:hypothetical protein
MNNILHKRLSYIRRKMCTGISVHMYISTVYAGKYSCGPWGMETRYTVRRTRTEGGGGLYCERLHIEFSV